jgi:hypothetical protein
LAGDALGVANPPAAGDADAERPVFLPIVWPDAEKQKVRGTIAAMLNEIVSFIRLANGELASDFCQAKCGAGRTRNLVEVRDYPKLRFGSG